MGWAILPRQDGTYYGSERTSPGVPAPEFTPTKLRSALGVPELPSETRKFGVGCVGWVCRCGNSFLNVCSSHHFLIFAKKTFLLVPLGRAKYVKPLQFPVSPPGRNRPLPGTITVRRRFGFFQTISLSLFRSPPGRFLFLAAFGQTRFLLLSLRRGGISF